MNLVNLVKDQFTQEITGKLGSLVGGSEDQTKTALGAAVPALLGAFSKLASGGGAGELTSAINKFDAGSLSQITGMLGGNPEQALQKGDSLLSTLLGGSTLTALANMLAKVVGLDAGSVKKLLATVSPLVLGTIAKQFQGKPATAQGLTNLFAEQKANIADAMPAGLSLKDLPGLSDVRSAATNVSAAAKRTAGETQETGSSLMKTLLPLGALALVGFLAWQFLGGREENTVVTESTTDFTEITAQKPVVDIAEALPIDTQVSDNLRSVFDTATETLSGITDAASAQAALPALGELSTKVEGLTALQKQLPATARTTIAKFASDNIGKLRELIEKVLAIPGVGEKLEPVLNELMTKLKTFEDAA